MVKWPFIFAVISIIAGIFGFTGVAGGGAAIAQVLFVIALALFVIFLDIALVAGKQLSD